VPEIKWKLGECADTAAANCLFRLLFKAARETSVADLAWRVLCAYVRVLDALIEYRTGVVDRGEKMHRFLHREDRLAPALELRLLGQLKKLRRGRPKDWQGLLEKMVANPDHVPELLSALWRAATSIKLLREGKGRGIEVRIGGKWEKASEEPWYLLLMTEPQRFLSLLDHAIASVPSQKSDFDYKRRLRELIQHPTSNKLHNFFEDIRARSKDENAVAKDRFTRAGRTTDIFPNGLPADFIDRIANRPAQIRKLASAVLDQIKRTTRGSGRPADEAMQGYADRIAAAYNELTGKTIGYARGTGNVRSPRQGRTYGLGAELMIAALKLADASMGISQAQAHIDRIRRLARQNRLRLSHPD